LHSVNYLHSGAPKTWYVIPPAARERFEQLMQSMLPELFRGCPEFMRHKVCVWGAGVW
jgi:jumonji domain-containing protein 2